MQQVEPPGEPPESFSVNGNEAIPDQWWKAFKDEQLNFLIDSALSGNLDLKASYQQILAAEAVLKQRASFLWPEFNFSARSAVSRPEPDFAGGENLQLGVSTNYEIDLWGRIKSAREAAGFRTEASLYDYQAAALSLSSQIAISWYQLLTARQQIALLNEQIATNENIVRLIRARFGGGQTGAVDILRQMQLLESTRNQKITIERDLALIENQLSVLLGRYPGKSLDVAYDSLPELPPLPDAGLPLELIRRRPDVKRAYSLVLAADRDMAEAVRNKFPRLSFNLSAQMRSNNYESLFQDWAYTLAGNIFSPLFYAGRLRAEVDRTEAVKNQLLHQYGQTVLIAFREVEDALISEQKQIERIDNLKRQLKLARQTNRQLRLSFINGLVNYLDVLVALDQEQQLRRDLLSARRQQLEIRINLYRALSGAFDDERIAEES
nr:efflux transporter outer membrane subunit [Robertkochia sp. 3YJGBD-33]